MLQSSSSFRRSNQGLSDQSTIILSSPNQPKTRARGKSDDSMRYSYAYRFKISAILLHQNRNVQCITFTADFLNGQYGRFLNYLIHGSETINLHFCNNHIPHNLGLGYFTISLNLLVGGGRGIGRTA